MSQPRDPDEPRWKLTLTMDDGATTEWDKCDADLNDADTLILRAPGGIDSAGLSAGRTGEFRASFNRDPTSGAFSFRVMFDSFRYRRAEIDAFGKGRSILTLRILQRDIDRLVPGSVVTLADVKGYGLEKDPGYDDSLEVEKPPREASEIDAERAKQREEVG